MQIVRHAHLLLLWLERRSSLRRSHLAHALLRTCGRGSARPRLDTSV